MVSRNDNKIHIPRNESEYNPTPNIMKPRKMHQATRKEVGTGSRKDLSGSADDRGKNRLDKIYVAGPPTNKKNELKVIKLQNKDIAYSARKAQTKLSKDIMVAGEDRLPE